MQTWIAYIKKTWIAYIKLKKLITNPIKMFMNFAKTMYLSIIKEKSYIQIKKHRLDASFTTRKQALGPPQKYRYGDEPVPIDEP